MDYKATLNLPKTDFPMKADLVRREPERLAHERGGEPDQQAAGDGKHGRERFHPGHLTGR